MTDMNLGNANLHFVNTSRPQLIHTISKQSVAVSDDYYSLASEESTSDDRKTTRQYQTPPSHMISPAASRDTLQSETTIAPIKTTKHEQPGHRARPSVVSFENSEIIKRKLVSSEGIAVQQLSNTEISPPTPGVDDTPYIRFAIDQLTRDEELLGQRRQAAASEDSYPVGRIIPDESLGYYKHGDQSTYHERRTSDPEIKRPSSLPRNNVLLPTDPTGDNLRYPKLDFIPGPLRFAALSTFIICCVLIAAALIFCNIWSAQHTGLLQYDGTGTGRYFLFQYLPQLLASIVVLWLFVIQCAIQRTLPFSALSSGRDTQNSGILYSVALFPTHFMIPNLSYFKYGEPLLGSCNIIFWLSLFTVPLQSSLFQTRYFMADGQDVWMWTAVQPVGWTLLVLYLLLVIALLLLLLRSLRNFSCLLWDPRSLADILVLFHRSNILSDFEGSEIQTTAHKGQNSKLYRLGYWTTSSQPTETFYGIGEENAPAHRDSLEGGKLEEKFRASDPTGMDLEGQRPLKSSTPGSLKTDVHSSSVRYRWVPWFLRNTFVVAWIVIAVVLMLAFVVVSFVNHAVQNGFVPLLPAPTTLQGFSPADFLYSFVPALMGMMLFLLWQPIDLYFRALQPFASLATQRGCTAEHSLLLDYSACLPIEVTIKAALAGHYKVAWISFISLLSLTFPILGGGVFTAQWVVATQDVRMIASMPAYDVLVVFVVIYALSFLVLWPKRKRHLPHDISTLSQLLSFVYQSPLLRDEAFKAPRSKIDLVTRLLGPPRGEKSSPKYAFGVYVGRDGKEHLGIDRLQRPGSGEMLITTGTMR